MPCTYFLQTASAQRRFVLTAVRSIDELVKEIVISETQWNHLGTKKVIVMDDKLAARVANHPEAIERLLKKIQAICAPHTQ